MANPFFGLLISQIAGKSPNFLLKKWLLLHSRGAKTASSILISFRGFVESATKFMKVHNPEGRC